MKDKEFKSLLALRFRNMKWFYAIYLILFVIIGVLASSSVLIANSQYPSLLTKEQKEDVFDISRFISFPSGSLNEKELDKFPIKSISDNARGKYESVQYSLSSEKETYFSFRPLSILRDTGFPINGVIGDAWNEVVVSRVAEIPATFYVNFTYQDPPAQRLLLKRTAYVETTEPYIFINDELMDVFNDDYTPELCIADPLTGSDMNIYEYTLHGEDDRILLPPDELKLLADIQGIEYEGDSLTSIAQKLTDKKLSISDPLKNLYVENLTFGFADLDQIILPHTYAKKIVQREYSMAYIPSINDGQRMLEYLDKQGIKTNSYYSYLKQKAFIPEPFVFGATFLLILMVILYIFLLCRSRVSETKYLKRYPVLDKTVRKIDRLFLFIGSIAAFVLSNAILLILRFCFYHLGRLTYITPTHFLLINLLCITAIVLIWLEAASRKKSLS